MINRLTEPDAGVKVGVEQVGREVGQGEGQDGDHGDGLHQGQIAAIDGELTLPII